MIKNNQLYLCYIHQCKHSRSVQQLIYLKIQKFQLWKREKPFKHHLGKKILFWRWLVAQILDSQTLEYKKDLLLLIFNQMLEMCKKAQLFLNFNLQLQKDSQWNKQRQKSNLELEMYQKALNFQKFNRIKLKAVEVKKNEKI